MVLPLLFHNFRVQIVHIAVCHPHTQHGTRLNGRLACHTHHCIDIRCIRFAAAQLQIIFIIIFIAHDREDVYKRQILYRTHHFSLSSELRGTPLLLPGQTLMELKTSGGIPLWMSHALTVGRIYQTSFSKYGSAYQNLLAQG